MNRIATIAAATVLSAVGLARADYPPSTSTPSGYPPTLQAATPPVQQQQQQQQQPQPLIVSGGTKVQVFPFEPVGNPAGSEWVGRGIQASLQSDVSHSGASLLMSPGPAAGSDPVAAARANGAQLAVTGTYQVENGTVRADAHVVDTSTGQPIGGFSGRAPVGSVFQLEDAMGEQLRRLLPPDRATGTGAFAPVAGAVTNDGTPVGQPTQPTPQTVIVDSTPTYAEPATVNNYYAQGGTGYADGGYYPTSYGGYGYPYGGYYGAYDPFVFGFYGGVGFYPGFYGRGYYHGYGYGHGYGHGYGYGNRGYGGYSRGSYGYGGYGHGGYVTHPGGGRSYGYGGGFHSAGSFGGGFHGGGGGHR